VTGTARVDGLLGIFEDFEREDPPVEAYIPIPRLSLGIPLMFLPLTEDDRKLFLGNWQY